MNMNHCVGSVFIRINREGDYMKNYIAFEPSVKPLSEESEEDLYYIYGGDNGLVFCLRW